MSLVYLNGEYMPLKEARISVLDRGFTFGDGVYELIPVYKQQIFCLDAHIKRLDNSLSSIYMENPFSLNQWQEILNKLIKNNTDEFQSLYVQVTRGISERDHSINFDAKPTVFVMNKSIKKTDNSKGIRAVTSEDIRWQRCNVKAITLLPSVLLRHEAAQKNADEAILLRDNRVTEGAASNVFIVKDRIVSTPVKDNFLLPGITRDLVVTLLNEAGIQCNETTIMREDLLTADEIWITSSTWEIVPVIKLDEQPVGDSRPGKMWHESTRLYQEFKDTFLEKRN
jgi:D-alanine transaminase